MKRWLLYLLCWAPCVLAAQSQQATLMGNWQDTSLIPTNAFDSRYSEVWGVAVNGHEIAVLASTEGTHFIDVTAPSNPVELTGSFVPGVVQGPNVVVRDYHDYAGYLYAVADRSTSALQIIDLSGLPDSTSIVYESDALLIKAHNIFIDSARAKLYAVGGVLSPLGNAEIIVYSLDDPTDPKLIGSFNSIGPVSFNRIHDLHVRNDTAYLNAGNDGLILADFSDTANPVLLGTLTSYPEQGYNHSGWLDAASHYYYLADETHGRDLKAVDVCDPQDIHVTATFDADSPASTSIPHNAIVRCNRLYVSYYYDGLQVFDLSDPMQPQRIYHYDTYDGPDDNSFRGAFGVYPLLPSGNILISDMQTGLYVFAAVEEDCNVQPQAACLPVDITAVQSPLTMVELSPNPVSRELWVTIGLSGSSGRSVHLELIDLGGRILYQTYYADLPAGLHRLQIPIIDRIAPGFYLMKISMGTYQITEKLIIDR